MKAKLLTLLGTAVMAAAPVFAGTPAPMTNPPPPPANDAGFFIGAKGGFFWLLGESVQQGSLGADVNFKTGWGITVPVGYDFGNGISVAFSAGYYSADIESIDVTAGSAHRSFSANGGVELVPLMANAAYTCKLIEKLDWYVGAGLGTVYSKDTLDSAGGQNIGYEDSSWDFGFQAFTGLRYHTCSHSTINLGYRFLHVNTSGDDHNGNALEIGFTWKF
jgi:opacity protein-like surface antigen